MKKQSYNRYDFILVDPEQGGFSEIWIWKYYLLFFGLVLFFAPFLGLFGSSLLIGLPALMLAANKASKIPDYQYDFNRWHKDFNYAFEHNQKLPDLEQYLVDVLPKKQEFKEIDKLRLKKLKTVAQAKSNSALLSPSS